MMIFFWGGVIIGALNAKGSKLSTGLGGEGHQSRTFHPVTEGKAGDGHRHRELGDRVRGSPGNYLLVASLFSVK